MVEELMMDTVKADKSVVPDTGVDPEWEYKLSSIFIDTAKGQVKLRRFSISISLYVLPHILICKRDRIHVSTRF